MSDSSGDDFGDLPVEKRTNPNPNKEAKEIRKSIRNGLIDLAIKQLREMHVSRSDKLLFVKALLSDIEKEHNPNGQVIQRSLAREYNIPIK